MPTSQTVRLVPSLGDCVSLRPIIVTHPRAAILDRGYYSGAVFKNARLVNAVLTGSSFDGADLTDSDFTGSYLGQFDAKALCKNPTLQGTNPITKEDTRESAGC